MESTPAHCTVQDPPRYTLSRDALARLLDGQDLVALVGQLLAERSADVVEQPRGKFFSHVEQLVIDLLSREAPLSRPAIARALRLPASGMIRGILGNLVERDVLVWSRKGDRQTGGYYLAGDEQPARSSAGPDHVEVLDDDEADQRQPRQPLSDADLAQRIAEAQKAKACQCGD